MTCLWLLLSPERLICQCLRDRASETTTAPLISGFWIPSMGSRIRQVMSPTTAHLPSRPFTLHSTLRTHFLINCLLLLGLSFGMSPVTVSLLPTAMAITVADFCQCLSLHCYCRTFTLLLAQLSNKPFLFSQFALACIASCIFSFSNATSIPLRLPEGSRREEKPAELLFAFCPPLLSDPDSRGSSIPRVHPLPSTEGKGPSSLQAH